MSISILIVMIVLAVAAFRFRYVLLSRLNVSQGQSTSSLELKKVNDISLQGGASRFDYQSIDPVRGLLFISHLGASQVIVFDLKQGKVLRYIDGIDSVHGILVVPETGRVYAAATGTHQVAVIDEQTLKIIARVDGGDYPDGLAYDPLTKKVFISDESGGADIVIDTTTDQRIDRIDLGGEVGNTQYDAAGHQMIAAAQGKGRLDVIDPAQDKVTSSIGLNGCSGPHGFTLDSPDRMAYVSCEGNAKLLAVDLSTKKVTASESVGDIPDVLAFDPGLKRLYVASESGVVSVFNVQGTGLQKIGEGYLAPNAHSIAVDPQTHRVYVPLENLNGGPALEIYEPAEAVK